MSKYSEKRAKNMLEEAKQSINANAILFANQHKDHLCEKDLIEVTNLFTKLVEDLYASNADYAIRYTTAPAASRHHQNYIGGLLEHSYKMAMYLSQSMIISGLTAEDCAIIAFAHDLCKVETYYWGPFKTETGERSILVDPKLYKRHAIFSVEEAARLHIELTRKQTVAILLHMSLWSSQEEKDAVTYTELLEFYPAIVATQAADLTACK